MQGSLFGTGELEVRTATPVQRTWLDAHCWVDHAHGWLGGQMELYDRLTHCRVSVEARHKQHRTGRVYHRGPEHHLD